MPVPYSISVPVKGILLSAGFDCNLTDLLDMIFSSIDLLFFGPNKIFAIAVKA